jgi:hypothetical protein
VSFKTLDGCGRMMACLARQKEIDYGKNLGL